MSTLLISLLTSLSIFLIVYHHAGYPLLLHFLSKRLRGKNATDTGKDRLHQKGLPSITIVIPAYNEEQFIAEKIRNLSILNYPQDKFNIVIASDGSTDSTYATALKTLREPECRHCAIKVIKFEKNVGKIAILNSLISTFDTDILALSDVSALISIDALQLAIKHFRDPAVGVVNGMYRLLNPGSEGEKKYWEYQSKLKSDEARLGSVIGSHGAFYLLRTHLYRSLPADTINDDFMIPMQIVKQGYRSIYDANIIALEMEQAKEDQDSNRRIRISAGNLQQALRLKSLLLPRYRGTAFTFASGKVLRVLMPYLMIIAFVGSIYLSFYYPVFFYFGITQALIYALYFALEILNIGDSSKLLQTLKYLLRGHINGLKGSANYMKVSFLKSISKKPEKAYQNLIH
jgi:cellulose synthase/poly-beta-1,6-N-acetylglucosamine synthase-like glycosyltransferase